MQVAYTHNIPHKLAMYRLLTAILKDNYLANNLFFKGGSCAAMLGYLDRFSLDLDFDLVDKSKKKQCRERINKIIKKLGYEIKDQSKEHLQFFLKYREAGKGRNTLKLEIVDIVAAHNIYQRKYLIDIDRYCQVQDITTMFANKLVACKARFEKNGNYAGRDIYDIHYFLNQGYGVNWEVIKDLRGMSGPEYLRELIIFIKKEVKENSLMEDLNVLLPKKKLKKEVPSLKQETIVGLEALSNIYN